MQKEIGHAQDVGQMLFLDAGEAFLDRTLVGLGLGLFAKVLDGTNEEAAGAAGGVENRFAQPGIDLIDDELGDCSRSVEFALTAWVASARRFTRKRMRRATPDLMRRWASFTVVNVFPQPVAIATSICRLRPAMAFSIKVFAWN